MFSTSAFSFEPDAAAWKFMSAGTNIDAEREVMVPGVECSRCQVWSSLGSDHPEISGSSVRGAVGKLDRATVSLGEFRRIKRALEPLGHGALQVEPGTAFGPLIGRARRVKLDIVWLTPWIPLVTHRVKEVMLRILPSLRMVKSRIEIDESPEEPLYELLAPRFAKLKMNEPVSCCEECGRPEIEPPDRIVLDKAAWEPDCPLQRINQIPTYLIATKALEEVVKRERLVGAKLAKVDLA